MTIEAGLESMNDAMPSRADVRNRLLAKMSVPDFALLAPHLEMVSLKERQVVEVPGRPIPHVYFVETGVVSVVAVNTEDHRIRLLTFRRPKDANHATEWSWGLLPDESFK